MIKQTFCVGVLMIVGVVVGCGSSDTKPLDCAWIKSDNCWKRAVADLAACVPQPDQNGSFMQGTLDAERRVCSYEGGPVVTFDKAVIPWNPASMGVTVEKNGKRCARFERDLTPGIINLEVASGTVQMELRRTGCDTCGEVTIHCPDGSAFQTDDPLGAFQCDPDPENIPLGITEQQGPGSVGLDLNGGPQGQTTLFSCSYK